MAEAQAGTQLVVILVRVAPRRAEQVEAGGQRTVEEPGLGEADDTLLGVGPETQPDRGFPSAAQEVALREVDRAVEVGDLAKGIAQLRAREDVAFLELHHAEHFGLGEQRHPGDGQVFETVLRTLHHGEDQVHSRLLAVDLNFVALDAGLDVAVVVVDGQDALDVLVDPLALELARQDPELALLGGQHLLDLALVEAPGAPDDDLVDADATAFVDAEDDLDVAVRELFDLGGDLNLEIPLGLVVVLQHFLRFLHRHRVVDAAELEVDLVLEVGGGELLVPGEVDVPDERALDHYERDLQAALEILHLQLDVVEEPETEDGAHVLRELRRIKEAAGLRLDAAQDDRLLDTAIAFDGDVLDDDGAGRLSEGRGYCQQGRARTKNG